MDNGIKGRLFEAQLKLMNNRPFRDLTVKEIAYEAGCSRRTFYNYFSSTEDLLKDYFRIIAVDILIKIQKCPRHSPDTYIRTTTASICEHREFFLVAFNDPDINPRIVFDSIFKLINSTIEKIFPDHKSFKSEYLETFATGGLFDVMIKWIQSGCSMPDDEIAGLMIEVMEMLQNFDKN